MDFDSNYLYCDYRHREGDVDESAVLRIPYAMSEGGGVQIDITNKEPVRLCWLTKADEEKVEADKAEFAALAEYKKARIEEDRKKAFALVLDEFKDLGEFDEYKEIAGNILSFESAEALREKLYAVRGRNVRPAAKKPISQIRIPVGFSAREKNTELEEFMNKYLPNHKK